MIIKKLLLLALMLCIAPAYLAAQDFIIRPTPGEEIILAVVDVEPASPAVSPELSDAINTFNRVLWDDLSFAGFFTLAGKSFYPSQMAGVRSDEDIPYDAWDALPFQVTFLSTGTLDVRDDTVYAEMRILDMDQRKTSFGLNITRSTDQIRAAAHEWADEIVYRLSAGTSRGIASTKIAYSVKKGAAKEIYIMDYDGHNPRSFTHSGYLNLYPTWSSDNSKLSFLSDRTGNWEIDVYSYIDGTRLAFPKFQTFTSTPALSPDGKRICFAMRTSGGDTDIFVANLDGSGMRNITNHPAIDTSPAWSPSGSQIAFISSRGGRAGQVYICDADGANVDRILKEGGDADSPSWSPDGRWIAFHWKPRMRTYYDLFIAEISTKKINQLTTDSGSNESPSWAPDGRHLVFQSNRTGSDHIYIMLLDGRSEPRRISRGGNESSPAWGGYARR